MSMCLWVRAMDTYAKVIKIVEPKRKVLREAQEALNVMNLKLEAKQSQLREIEAKAGGGWGVGGGRCVGVEGGVQEALNVMK